MNVVVREPAGAAAERARQLELLRAFMQKGARGVALENIPATPPRPSSEEPDPHEAAAEQVKKDLPGDLAAKGARPTSAQGAAVIRRRAAALAAPSDDPGKLSDEELAAEHARLEAQLPQRVETPSRPYTEAEQAIVNRHSKLASERDSRNPALQERKRQLAEDYAAKAQKRQQPGYLQQEAP